MFTTAAMKRFALVLLSAGAVAGAAEAQTIPPGSPRSGQCNGGLFTLPGGTASFHVALDDDSSEPGILVLMRIISQNGTVVKSRTASLAPGGSATLEHRGTGLYRMQAETYEYPNSIYLSGRRTVVASSEVIVEVAPQNGTEGGRLIGPVNWIPCRELGVQ
jgi:hypothetical protein